MTEIDATRAGGEPPGSRAFRAPADTGHRLPEHVEPAAGPVGEVDDPDLARLQIERTRERMSDTLERIENSLLQRREQLEERLDVLGPARQRARENPLPAVGGIFLAGLLLGWATGRGDDTREEEKAGPRRAVRSFTPDFDRERAYVEYWEERARTWEHRARRLMEVANRQETELMETRGETVPVRRRGGLGLRRRRGSEEGPRRASGVDGMPFHRHGGGGEPDYLPAPI